MVQIVDLKADVMEDNDKAAEELRGKLKESRTFLLNLMSSPGSGKTTTLEKLIPLLKDELKIGVMEADIDSDVDAVRMSETGIKSIQLHTGGMCHLDAGMTGQGLDAIDYRGLDLVILENVGNLVCPAEFDTGSIKNLAIVSVPEGEDKPLKYPLMFQVADAVIINKIDVAPYFNFNEDHFREYVEKRHPGIPVMAISAKTGEGIEQVANWLKQEIAEFRK